MDWGGMDNKQWVSDAHLLESFFPSHFGWLDLNLIQAMHRRISPSGMSWNNYDEVVYLRIEDIDDQGTILAARGSAEIVDEAAEGQWSAKWVPLRMNYDVRTTSRLAYCRRCIMSYNYISLVDEAISLSVLKDLVIERTIE